MISDQLAKEYEFGPFELLVWFALLKPFMDVIQITYEGVVQPIVEMLEEWV